MTQYKKNKNISKKIMSTVLIVPLIFSLANCKNNNKQKYIDGAIAIVYENNTPYLINKEKETFSLKGYEIVDKEFKQYIIVKKNKKYGFIDNTGKLIIDTIYDKVYPMSEEKAVVITNDTTQIINTKGEVIYTFDESTKSESYFSQNHLVILANNKFDYLVYNPENESFTKTNFSLDYAKPFKNDYAVIGKYEQEIIYEVNENGDATDVIKEIRNKDNLKFNYLTINDNLLFDSFSYDFADNFNNNLARVGIYGKIVADTVGNIKRKHYIDGMVYSYIRQNGSYFNYNHVYIYNRLIDGKFSTERVELTDKLDSAYATNFSDGLAVVAKYTYSEIVRTYLKEYAIIDTTGDLPYTMAIYYKTGYRFGYDENPDYQTQSPSKYIIRSLLKIDDIPCLLAGDMLLASTWQFQYIRFDTNTNQYVIDNVVFDFDDDKQVPKWMIDYNEKYFNSSTSYILTKNVASYPYDVDDLKLSSFCDQIVTKTRISYSDTYGLVGLASEEYLNTSTNEISKRITAKYILDPIYENIIY